MSEANRSLMEFVTFLSSPDMYGSMSLAAQMLKWAVHAVVTVLMIAAVIAVLFIVLKFAVDVVFLTGVGNMMQASSNQRVQGAMNKIQGFASPGAIRGDIQEYLKRDLWKPIVTLAFVGLIASGMALPLAGQVAGMIGAGVDKLIGLDPATEIANFDMTKFKDSLTYTRTKDLKTDYDKYVAEAGAYRDYIYDLGTKNVGSDNQSLQRYKVLYTGAMMKAQAVSNSVKSKASELKLPATYFDQHTKDGMCQAAFMDNDTKAAFTGVAAPC